MDCSSYSPHVTAAEIGQKVRHLHPVRAMVAMQLNNLQLPFDRRALRLGGVGAETAGTELPKGSPRGLPAIAAADDRTGCVPTLCPHRGGAANAARRALPLPPSFPRRHFRT